MTDEDTIEIVEVQETDFGEKAVLKSPFDAKDFIKVMPWKTYREEVEENGSLRAKAEERGIAEGAILAAEDFNFSEDFETHVSWEPNALGRNEGAWTIDAESVEEATEFFEHCGFDVVIRGNVNL